jgi:hypothetical protein
LSFAIWRASATRGCWSKSKQARLKTALIAELDKMDLPGDGQHLGRIFRALAHLAVDMMQTVGLRDPVTAHLLHRVAKKSLKSEKPKTVTGVFGPIPEGKA